MPEISLMLHAFLNSHVGMCVAGMLHWTLVLGSSAPVTAVPGSVSRHAQLALPPPNQIIAHSGSLAQDQAAQAGLALRPVEHLMQATVSGLHSDLLNQLALLANGSAGVPQHSLPAIQATQPMQPPSSYTDLLSSVLFQSSSGNGQPASPVPGEAAQHVADPVPASLAAGARTTHQGASARQIVDAPADSNAGPLSVVMQPQQQQQSCVPGPGPGSGVLHSTVAPHTSAFLPYQRHLASESSTGGGALSAVSGALMRQDTSQLRCPQPMVPVTSSQDGLRDSPLSETSAWVRTFFVIALYACTSVYVHDQV